MTIQQLMEKYLYLRRIICAVLIGAILAPDFVRAMEDEQDNVNPTFLSNTVTSDRKINPSQTIKKPKLKRSSLDLSKAMKRAPLEQVKQNTSKSSESKKSSSDSATTSPRILVTVEDTSSSPEKNSASSSEDLISFIGQKANKFKVKRTSLDLSEARKRSPLKNTQDNMETLPKMPIITLEIKEKEQPKQKTKKFREGVNFQNKSSMFMEGDTIYIIDEEGGDLNKKEEFQKKSKENKSNSKKSTTIIQQNLESKLKEDFEIFEVADENSKKRDTNPSNNKQNAQIGFLKDSFSKLNKTLEKSLSSTVEENPLSTSFSINDMDQESLEKIPLLTNIKKAASNKPNSSQDPLKGILEEDIEKTAQAFEEWVETASDKTLCQELEVFFETSVALGSLFAQDLENLLKENSGLKKITIQDWLTHMGLGKGDHKVEILSKELIQFYEFFNQALSYHIATTLFKDKIPEENLEKFKAFLLHLKDYTIDGKLTWKQIAGALFGTAIGGLASYALYRVFGINLLEFFIYYNIAPYNEGTYVRPITGVLTGFIVLDAIVRNAKMFIDYFTPDTKRFAVPMDPKIAKALKWKKAGAYGWSILPSLIPIYYYKYYSFNWEFWAFGPFLYINSMWDNSSRLVSNAEKGTQKKFLQKIEEDYPFELKAAQTTLLKGLKKTEISLKSADQKDINHYYDVVYHSILSQTKDIKTENAKFAQTLHLLIFFLELENFKATEPNHKDSNSSSEVIQNSEMEEQKNPLETKESTTIIIREPFETEDKKPLLIDSKSSSEITQISEKQEQLIFEEEKEKEGSLSLSLETEDLQEKKSKTLKKIAYGASIILPLVGSVILWWGAKYMWGNVIRCPDLEHCWDNKVAIGILSGGLGLLTWGATSVVQYASVKKNIEDLPGTSKTPKVMSQRPFRVGWQLFNYVLGTVLAVPDFVLWLSATYKWSPGIKYPFISFATVPEAISTADSLNGSSSDLITGTNRVLSHVYAPEGFRRDKLREIGHDLRQFIKTLQPGVFKVLLKTLHSLQKVLKEGPENLPSHLKRLFDEKTLNAFTELSQIFKEKKEKYQKERKEEEKKKQEQEEKKNEKEMKVISEFVMVNDEN